MNASSTVRVPVCDLRCAGGLFHIRGRDDDAHDSAARPDPLDQLPELAPLQRVHTGRGFVEYQKIGIVDQRAAKAELLPHPAGRFLCRAVGEGRAWLNRNRRLAKDFEASIASAKAWVYIASVQLLIRRLA
jgi:hypothetical protein